MKLSQNDLFLLSQCAISAAFQAGQIIRQHSNGKHKVTIKESGTSQASQVLTEVDHLSQALILELLKPTCQQFDLALLTEESPDDLKRLEKDYFWCIDPLDGTLPFIESGTGYCVAIALISRQGIPYIGVIYDPVEQTLYHAIKGSGAFRNSLPWELPVIKKDDKTSLNFITDRSFIKNPHYEEVINYLQTVCVDSADSELNIIQQGGASMNACWVIEQSPACYFKFPKLEPGGGCIWDFAATACLFNETTAVVSDIYGQPLDLNRPDSTFMNHRGIIYASDTQLAKQIIALYQQLVV